MATTIAIDKEEQQQTIQRYYRWQSKIYDATRWSFLYGRKNILDHIPFAKEASLQILEVGCGTGKNLLSLARKFPNSHIIGLDVSKDMIKAATRKTQKNNDMISLKEMPYECGSASAGKFDIILFSYSLTMINPHWHELLLQAKTDLKEGGYVAVVDFHNSRFNWFKRHMGNNHVRMDGQLLPVLEENFSPHFVQIKSAYGFFWEYLQFVGRK